MKMIIGLCLATLAMPLIAQAYESAFPKTKAGTIEIKVIPERTLIVAEKEGGYFEENNALFRQLFRYIQDNEIAMTVPVKADIDPGKMYFYLGKKELSKELKETDSVKIITEPAHTVLSIGVRGGYSEKNYKKAREKLYTQLALSTEWKKCGSAYAIYWNGPFMPGFMKRFEVHVPVEPKPKEGTETDS